MECLKEDVVHQAESNEVELDESDIAVIAERFENALGKCCGYWDDYWGIMDYVINEYIKEGEDNND